MAPSPLMMICTCDLAAQVRGKAHRQSLIESPGYRGIGWTPTNSQITSHGPIAPSPWGACGDTRLIPDLSTKIDLAIGEDHHERFVLADIVNLDGSPWSGCPRAFLQRQITQLAERGFLLKAAFEHEFALMGLDEEPNSQYALKSFRAQGRFADDLFAHLEKAGLTAESFMPEYGPMQFEISIAPKDALRAADEAIILRELVRASARAHDQAASFAPLLRPDAVGNGVHIHFSLAHQDGRPANYDAQRPLSIASPASAFLEGVRQKTPALLALTAASTVSYLRLQPDRWSAYQNNIGVQDREAALRICPVLGAEAATGFHFEYRAADATANPYIALGGLIAAGLFGLEQGLEADAGEANCERLPESLQDALDRFGSEPALTTAMGDEFANLYLAHKRFEQHLMQKESLVEQCSRYARAF